MEKHIASTIDLNRLNGTQRDVNAVWRDAFADCLAGGFSSLTVRVEPNEAGELEIRIYGFQTGAILSQPDPEDSHGKFEPVDDVPNQDEESDE